MSLESKNFTPEETESIIPPEEKRSLAQAWENLVIGKPIASENIEQMSNEKLKDWLYKSMMSEVDTLVDAWKLAPDEKTIQAIKEENDPNKKSVLEKKFLDEAKERFAEYSSHFDHSGAKSVTWDSWPGIMRETREFNCVGSALLGISALEKAGIKQYYGNPVHHVINIAELTNGDLYYVDFSHGQVRLIKPEKMEIAGTEILKINDKAINYRLIPIYKKGVIIKPVIGNLACLNHEAEDPEAPNEIDKKMAIAYRNKHKEEFAKNDFGILSDRLFPGSMDYWGSDEIKAERQRIRELHDDSFSKKAHQYADQLPYERQKSIKKELSENAPGIRKLLFEDDESVLRNLSEEAAQFIHLYKEGADFLKKDRPAIFDEQMEGFLARISTE